MLLLLLLSVSALGPLLALEILATFRDPEDNAFQKLAVHQPSGSIYVGATNRLHRLTSDLRLSQSAATGPREDNPDCPPPIMPCSHPKQLTDSWTKGLVIDPERDSVILCTSLFHGSCQILRLDNITALVSYVQKPSVPNDPRASCVMFLAPGPVANQTSLYLGAEYSPLGDESYRDLVPSLSSRDPTSLELTHRDANGGTKMVIKPDMRPDFKVKFLAGFSYNGFVYFITTQPKALHSSELVTRISRLCQGDLYFRSFIEITLECQSSVASTGLVGQAAARLGSDRLAVAFSAASSDAGRTSSLCVYSLGDLDQLFLSTLQSCYEGQGKVGPAHYETIRTCIKMSGHAPDPCAGSPVSQAFPALEGGTGLESRSVLDISDLAITALTTGQEAGRDIVYGGASSGELVKILIDKTETKLVKRVLLAAGEPALEVVTSAVHERIYVLTTAKVYLLSTNHCESKQTCDECVDGIDPLCGWCVMENSCTVGPACPLSAFTPNWLPATQKTCLNVSNVDPARISYQVLQESGSSDKMLKFSLETVLLTPSSDLDLGCMYKSGDQQQRTPASVTSDRFVTCPLPELRQLAQIPQGKDHEDVSVHFHVKGKSIVTRSVSIFNCSAHATCESCAASSFDCKWCYVTGRCLEPRLGCQHTDGQMATWVDLAENCPKIWTQSKDSGILVHSGQQKQIAVRVMNLQEGQTGNVKCVFNRSGNTEVVDAVISSSSLTCSAVQFSFEGESPYAISDFQVTWGPSNLALDNPGGIQVRIYKCQQMVSYCGQCLSMDEEYECGWCQGACGDSTQCEGKCMQQKQCKNQWLDRTATCPNPQITRFSPTTGPLKGVISITVTGINLGKSYTEIQSQVAGHVCRVKPDHYQPATRFVCEVGQVDAESSGVISVLVDGKFTAKSDSEFVFVDPVLTSLAPKVGPVSGGTVLTLLGDHLDAGSDVVIKVAGDDCQLLRQNKTTLECTTPAHSEVDTGQNVVVSFGGYVKEVPEPFTYKPDPTISMIEPLKTIISGGTSITVRGDGLNLIQKPEFVTSYAGQLFTETCQVASENIMECQVPGIKSPGLNVTETSPLEVHYWFHMANVSSVKNISHDASFGPLIYYPDPIVTYFEEDDKTKPYHESDLLSIKGRFRMVNVLMASVQVYVGEELCSEISANDLAITCKAPASFPKGTDATGKAAVKVRIGNQQSVPGYIRYFLPNESNKPITLGIVLGVVLPILFIVVLLTICVLRRHRKHKPDHNFIPDVLKDYEGKKAGEDEEELIGLDNIPVKVDMNGDLSDKDSDSAPYVTELLSKFEEPVLRQNVAAALISRKRLNIGDLIGKGYHGVVYKAVYTHSDSDKQVDVAVKTLQARHLDVETMQQFLQDVALIRDLSHPHLLRVVGTVVSPSDDPIVVMPFMATEDLCTFIREPAKSINLADLLAYCHQVTDAMAYLENLKIVHRNLAARNCIILQEEKGDKRASIRLTDYVLSASLFPAEFYLGEEGEEVSDLVRWMAPESLEQFAWTSHSDVWSFGVLMWEVLTRGVEPYPDTPASEVIKLVKEGKRLPKPKHCPESIYQIILSCWSAEPSGRPLFVQLMEELRPYVSSEESELLDSTVDVGAAQEYKNLLG